jgi:hypothetical protein
MVSKIVFKALLLALIFMAADARPAQAYINPNTGGMLFQVLAVAFASLSAIVLFFSRQIRTAFARVMRTLRDGGAAGAQGGNPEPEPVDENR